MPPNVLLVTRPTSQRISNNTINVSNIPLNSSLVYSCRDKASRHTILYRLKAYASASFGPKGMARAENMGTEELASIERVRRPRCRTGITFGAQRCIKNIHTAIPQLFTIVDIAIDLQLAQSLRPAAARSAFSIGGFF